MSTHTCVHLHVCMCVCMFELGCSCECMWARMFFVYVHTHVCVWVHVYVCVCVFIWTGTYGDQGLTLSSLAALHIIIWPWFLTEPGPQSFCMIVSPRVPPLSIFPAMWSHAHHHGICSCFFFFLNWFRWLGSKDRPTQFSRWTGMGCAAVCWNVRKVSGCGRNGSLGQTCCRTSFSCGHSSLCQDRWNSLGEICTSPKGRAFMPPLGAEF